MHALGVTRRDSCFRKYLDPLLRGGMESNLAAIQANALRNNPVEALLLVAFLLLANICLGLALCLTIMGIWKNCVWMRVAAFFAMLIGCGTAMGAIFLFVEMGGLRDFQLQDSQSSIKHADF
ncbi:unnamed protein product [Schistocephalus solidus]|uniref:Uncharacterized protein n=1 Tax=Schistocephalus solidus TaxID=70667 RepID=A0A183STR8_SCHSO|nr:unnamed protein product [Schistocephalus solidus]